MVMGRYGIEYVWVVARYSARSICSQVKLLEGFLNVFGEDTYRKEVKEAKEKLEKLKSSK